MFNSVFRRVSIASLLLLIAIIPLLTANVEIEWEKSLENGMIEAKKTNKPIMLDFYTDT